MNDMIGQLPQARLTTDNLRCTPPFLFTSLFPFSFFLFLFAYQSHPSPTLHHLIMFLAASLFQQDWKTCFTQIVLQSSLRLCCIGLENAMENDPSGFSASFPPICVFSSDPFLHTSVMMRLLASGGAISSTCLVCLMYTFPLLLSKSMCNFPYIKIASNQI